ncbi:MAG: hypothetical protein ABIS86_07325 [Streptosporangiaceae bacterium]
MTDKPEPGSEELLANSPFKGDLDAELTPRQPRAKLPGLTLWLGATLIAVVGFLAGTQADQAWGSKSDDDASARGNGGLQNRQFPGGDAGQRQGGVPGGFTAGTITKVEGGLVFLKTADGRTVQVTTNGTTQIKITKDGKAADLKAGSTVTVRGQAGSDGSVTATSVTEGGGLPGAGGSGGGGFGGQRPGG